MTKYIVSDDHKFVYFVVQKVACSSIKTALLPFFDIDPAGPKVVVKDGNTRLRIHELYSQSSYQINKKQLVAKLNDEYRDYFKFAFVRNPWDRLVSLYWDKFAKNGPGVRLPEHVEVVLYPGMPFAEFVEAVYAIPDRDANIHFKSQYRTICGPGRDKPVMADFIGRFENLAADFAVVAKGIGSAQELQLPHIIPHKLRSESRKSRPPYADFYNDRLRKLVYKRYQEDIEIFGYSY
jgi:hypothetical protein